MARYSPSAGRGIPTRWAAPWTGLHRAQTRPLRLRHTAPGPNGNSPIRTFRNRARNIRRALGVAGEGAVALILAGTSAAPNE